MFAAAVRNVEDVELAAGCGFQSGCLAGIMGYMVTIDDVVVPVSLTRLKQALLEFKGTLPSTRL